MSTQSSFFAPQTISILLCLHEIAKQSEQVDPKDPLVQFIIKKILTMTEEDSIQTTNQAFQAEMLSIVGDMEFLEKYHEILSQIDSFNSFYREISNHLKTLRSIRSNKLEQGNVVDFLIRRLYIYFEKLDFKQIVTIYENFNAYKEGREFKLRRHEFMLTKSIEQVKFNLQNYQLRDNPQQINKMITDLAQYDHTFKTSYVRGLLKAEQHKPNQSHYELHRYFDKCLGNLFQEKTESSAMSNKINHCILSSGFSSLKMGHLEESLQSISEGLRISQNNSDEESINNCIIYLYKIAEQLGKHRQEILLAEHAITHSLNLSNIVLMVYSCLCYSAFEKKYNCQDSEVALLKSRHISWTDALHFSKKKIYSNFQSNCKNIYHSHRSLLIPSFLHKLSILIHIPKLKKLLLNPYYDRKELNELEVYQQFLGNTKVQNLLRRAKMYLNMNQLTSLDQAIKQLSLLESEATSPETIIKIRTFRCKVKQERGVDMDLYRQIQQLISMCRKYGFVKSHLIQAQNCLNKVLFSNNLYFDALVKVQETIQLCDSNNLHELRTSSQLLKAQIQGALGNLNEAFALIQNIEEKGTLNNLDLQSLSLFWETKLLLTFQMGELLKKDIDFIVELNEIKKTQFQILQTLLKSYIEQGCLSKIKNLAKQIQDFCLINPLVVPEKQRKQNNLTKVIDFLQRVEVLNSRTCTMSSQQYDEQKIHKKIMGKIHQIYTN